jgi:Uma2 family endonuclease
LADVSGSFTDSNRIPQKMMIRRVGHDRYAAWPVEAMVGRSPPRANFPRQEDAMSEAHWRTVWTWESYLEWEADQPVRYELVDGQVYAVGGGTAEHDTVGNNLRGELRTQLRDKPCRAHGPDLKVHARRDGRYPDALVDCGKRVAGTLVAQQPVIVFEILPRDTPWIDQALKLRDYDATDSLRHYLLVNQEEPCVLLYTRGEDGRLDIQNSRLIEGALQSINIPECGLSIQFSALYEGLEFTETG